jgi:putative ABC transport system permease protein
LQTRLDERLRALPGVMSVSSASRAPLGGNTSSTRVAPQAAAAANEQRQQFLYSYVSREYFQTLGIRLLRGRTFTAAEVDTDVPVAIVSNSLARRFWPDGDAVGKRLAIGSPTEVHDAGRRAPLWPSAEVIGVAPDIYSVDLTAPDPGAVYLPKLRDEWNSIVLVRVAGNPDVSSGALVREVLAMEPDLAVSVETLRDTMASSGISVVFRVSSMIFGAIGFLGLVLASAGIYSLVAYSVSQRTREVGIRMALGARPVDVVRLILRGSAKSITAGLLLGAGLGVLLSLMLSSRLFLQGARLIDPLVILGVSLLTGGFAMLASYVPARRVTTLNPATTLRFE